MNNRFKFRIFSKTVKKFIYFDEPELSIDRENMGLLFRSKHLYLGNYEELQQCTGLKDKNGNLIYEGDIINCFDCRICSRSFPLVEKGIITYKKAQFIVNTKFSEYLFEDIEDIEIIGNIYENKELLGRAEDDKTM